MQRRLIFYFILFCFFFFCFNTYFSGKQNVTSTPYSSLNLYFKGKKKGLILSGEKCEISFVFLYPKFRFKLTLLLNDWCQLDNI